MKGEPSSAADIDTTEDIIDHYLDSRGLKSNNPRAAWGHLMDFLETKDYDFEEMDEYRAADFGRYLKEVDSINEQTAEFHFGRLTTLVGWYQDRGRYDYNPFALASEEISFEYNSETVKRRVGLNELRKSINEIRRPPILVFVVLLLKTGLRIAEALNLDWRDIHIDHEISEIMPDPRAEVADKPDALYVDSSINKGEKHNGEVRTANNKPKSYRVIPLDQEMKDTLVWWIAMSPPSPSPAQPLLRKTRNGMGGRYSKSWCWGMFVEWAQEQGWHEWEGDRNVTPHWCRHWFTTMLRERIDAEEVEIGTRKGYVKALRGDSDKDTIDIYTQDWGNNDWIRDVYEDNIPNLFVDKEDD